MVSGVVGINQNESFLGMELNCQIYFSYVRCVPACSNQPRPNPRVGSCLVGRGLGYPGSKSILGGC